MKGVITILLPSVLERHVHSSLFLGAKISAMCFCPRGCSCVFVIGHTALLGHRRPSSIRLFNVGRSAFPRTEALYELPV